MGRKRKKQDLNSIEFSVQDVAGTNEKKMDYSTFKEYFGAKRRKKEEEEIPKFIYVATHQNMCTMVSSNQGKLSDITEMWDERGVPYHIILECPIHFERIDRCCGDASAKRWCDTCLGVYGNCVCTMLKKANAPRQTNNKT